MMKKKICAIWILVVIAGVSLCIADLPPVGDSVKMPAELAAINKAADLAKYLKNPDETIRVAAVKRLAEIGGADAIQLIIQFYESEPYRSGMDLPDGVKREALIALGALGGERAKAQVLKTLKATVAAGPTVRAHESDRREIKYDAEYRQIVTGALEALSTFDDADAQQAIADTFANENLHWYIRQFAQRVNVQREMKTKGVTSLENKVHYLVRQLTGSGVGEGAWAPGGGKTVEALKNGALQDILADLGPRAIPYLESEIKRILTVKTGEAKKIAALNEVIKRIESIEKGRGK
jgi:hypothetical protein